jgi:integrase
MEVNTMPLSDVKARNAKPTEKQFKLSDGDGMYLLVTPNGGKCWRLKYRFHGKEKLLALGTYPEISLSVARKKRDEARELLASGVDPGQAKQREKAAKKQANDNSFETVAHEWHENNKAYWTDGYTASTLRRLELEVFPYLGSRPIAEITPPELLKVIRRIESRDALEVARLVRSFCSAIFRYAVATGRAERDQAADLKGALKKREKSHLAAITDPKGVAGLLRSIDDFQGSPIVKSALRLAPLVFTRPGELRKAEWSEIDLETAEWNIPAERMKMKIAHLVPLSHQAVDILKELQPFTGTSKYVFPNEWNWQKPMSENAMLAALRRMGYSKDEMTPHGFRAMARTILDEVLQVRPDFIEHQLAHAVKDPNGRAYNRTAHLAERRKMMQTWADYLDGLKSGAKVIPLKRAE